MRLLRGVLAASAVAVFVLAVTACGGYGDDNGEEGGSTTIGGMTAELHGTKDVSGETGKVEIELYDDYFEPTILKGEPGQKVTLELKNEGENPHTLTISDQGDRPGSPAGRRGRGGRHVPAERRARSSSAGSTRTTAWSARSRSRARPPGRRRRRRRRRRPRTTSRLASPGRDRFSTIRLPSRRAARLAISVSRAAGGRQGAAKRARHDSNMRPLPPQGSALSPELRARDS